MLFVDSWGDYFSCPFVNTIRIRFKTLFDSIIFHFILKKYKTFCLPRLLIWIIWLKISIIRGKKMHHSDHPIISPHPTRPKFILGFITPRNIATTKAFFFYFNYKVAKSFWLDYADQLTNILKNFPLWFIRVYRSVPNKIGSSTFFKNRPNENMK